jgi:hypothetical protein
MDLQLALVVLDLELELELEGQRESFSCPTLLVITPHSSICLSISTIQAQVTEDQVRKEYGI